MSRFVTLRVHSAPMLVAVLCVAASLALPASASASALTHSFDANDQGWRSVRTAACDAFVLKTPIYSGTGGNPNGHISDEDNAQVFGGVDDCLWYFFAPATVSGNLRANYGGTVAYDLRHPAGADHGGQIEIYDQQGNGLLGIKATPPAANTWTTYSFGLTETASGVSWFFYDASGNGDVPATNAHFFEVLSDVEDVLVLADLETSSNLGITQFDNFRLTDAPTALDSDSDGVTNAADQCPLVAGPASNNGCPIPPPDADGDGVPDPSDNCRIQPGPASNAGCPLPVDEPQPSVDADGDGLLDSADNCPAEAGPPANNGCPAVAADTDPPETTITKKPGKQTRSTSARFTFDSNETATFECKLDKRGFKPCTSPMRLRNLKLGRHTLQVRATDAAGNVDVTPTKATWTVVDR